MKSRIFVRVCLVAIFLSLLQASARASDLRRTAVVEAIQRALPSVASIHTEKTVPTTGALFSQTGTRKINGMGTGIIVDSRGYILTNFHVVQDVDHLSVTLHNGSKYDARVISFDTEHDLAVIKIDPSDALPEAPIGTSSDLLLGETVIAIGNAFGYEDTVTMGIISALSRDVEVNETQKYENLIQTDASINPGNSGGPLINLDGEIIGVNVAIRAGAQRIGFAIPIDDARRVLADLISTERLAGTFHGLVGQDYKQGPVRELRVKSVKAGSPAEEAGVRPGDVVLAVDGQPVVDQADFERRLLAREPGQPVDLLVRRGSEEKHLTLRLAKYPRKRFAQLVSNTHTAVSDPRAAEVWRVIGIRGVPVPSDDEQLRRYGYRGGLLITNMRAGSPAEQNGIRVGDILVGLHIWETLNLDNILYVLRHPQRETFDPVKFYVVRNGEVLYGYMRLSQ